jgi:hypothetical protein
VLRHRKDGSELPLWITASNVLDEAGKIVNSVRVFTDISELKATQRKLEALATKDALTGTAEPPLFQGSARAPPCAVATRPSAIRGAVHRSRQLQEHQ